MWSFERDNTSDSSTQPLEDVNLSVDAECGRDLQ